MTGREAEITVVGVGGRNSRVIIGGHDVTHMVRSVEFSAEVGEFPGLTIDLAPSLTRAYFDRARVAFPEDVRSALVALGWTPPPWIELQRIPLRERARWIR